MITSLRPWLLVCSLLATGCTPVWFLTERHDALVWPVSLEQGRHESPPFSTKFHQRRYRVVLNVKRTIPFDALGCYMGTAVTQDKCGTYPNQIDVKWKILGNGKPVVSGIQKGEASASTWGGKDTERFFGEFMAIEGTEYRMRIEVLQDGTLLKAANPTFQIYACRNPTNEYIECHQ